MITFSSKQLIVGAAAEFGPSMPFDLIAAFFPTLGGLCTTFESFRERLISSSEALVAFGEPDRLADCPGREAWLEFAAPYYALSPVVESTAVQPLGTQAYMFGVALCQGMPLIESYTSTGSYTSEEAGTAFYEVGFGAVKGERSYGVRFSWDMPGEGASVSPTITEFGAPFEAEIYYPSQLSESTVGLSGDFQPLTIFRGNFLNTYTVPELMAAVFPECGIVPPGPGSLAVTNPFSFLPPIPEEGEEVPPYYYPLISEREPTPMANFTFTMVPLMPRKG